jgi:acyl-CoA reductase-like NAD-dependent aldehyde dehydrogenase
MNVAALRAASTEERAEWLGAAVEHLLRRSAEACEALSKSTGLSEAMVAWGARTTLETMRPESLRALAEEARAAGGEPISALSIVLAGNLFTAAARAVLVPLLLGIPVTVKASSRETLFPRLLQEALRRVDPELGEAIEIVVFAGGDVERETSLIEGAERTAVYGSDRTIDAMQQRHPNANLIAHGHGVSAAYCGPEALREGQVEETIEQLALDVCAYDQRGCLSPQIIYAAADSEPALFTFVERLASEGLAALEKELPRGPLPVDVGAAQAQWRGLAEVEGSLVVGNTYGIAVRPPQPVRWSPGYRNVTLAPVRDRAEAVRAMEAFGTSLKCVGADPISSASLGVELDRNEALSAYLCPLGTMQTPPLDALADGKPVWQGLLR